ncbi:MAG: histidine phosphatase family protein [Myxococcota bacterium]
MRHTLYLMRHGESEVNAADPPVIGGRSRWAELTPLGVEQSRRLGRWLGEQQIPVDRIISSTAVRAQQTARYALDALKIPRRRLETFVRLEEMSQGEWENQLRTAVRTPAVMAQMDRETWHFRAPGGESMSDVYERGLRFIQDEVLAAPHAHTWIFCHGMVIKTLLAGVMGLERTTAWQIWIDNASLTVLEHEDGQWTERMRSVVPPQ